MSEDTITTLPDPSGFLPDPLTGVIRDGARKLIEQAIEAELAALMAPDDIAVWRCDVGGASFENAGTGKLRDRRGDDVAGRVFWNG